MGDALTVKANNLQLYKGTTWEIVDAVYMSHTKSLIDIDAESVTVAKEGGDFAVKATVKGENIKVDYDADWITLNGATKEGEEVTLNFTAAPNEGEPRSAVMTLSTSTAKGDSSTKEFTVKQEGSVLTKTVSEILQLELNADVQSSVSLVSAVTARGFVATDGVKAVYVYTQGTDFNGIAKVGDNVRFSGSKTVYSGVHEVQNITALEVVSSGNAVVYPTATDVTADALTYTADEAVYVSLVGTLAKSGNFYNITLDGIDPGTKQGSIVYPTADLGADALDGKKIKVTGYFNGLSSGGKYLNIIATGVEAVE